MTPRGLLGLLALPAVLVFLLFFVLPVALVTAEAFSDGGAAFLRVLADPVFRAAAVGSLAVGTLAPLFSTLVGLAIALQLSRMGEGGRAVLTTLVALPLTFSGLIVAYGFILVFGRAGFVTLLLAEAGADPAVVGGWIFTPSGLGFAYSYYLIPRVVLLLLPVVTNFDWQQIATARSLGASTPRAYLDILLPQILPALLTAFCFTAAVAIGAYGTALALVGTQVPLLSLLLYSKISDSGADFPAAAALSLILMALCCLVVAAAEAFRRDGAEARIRAP